MRKMITKKHLLIVAFLLAILGYYNCLIAQTFSDALPVPKKSFISKNHITVTSNATLIYDESFHNKYMAAFDSLKNTLDNFGSPDQSETNIVFSKVGNSIPIDKEDLHDLEKMEAYMIVIKSGTISIISKDDHGLLNGLSTLESLVMKYNGKLPQGKILDYPDLKMRVLQLSLWPTKLENYKEAIKLARLGHYNTLLLLSHRGVQLKSLEHLKTRKNNKLSVSEFKEIVEFSKQNGMEVIPELKLLSHQKHFMADKFPEYMYNKATYDPRNKDMYHKVVFPAIDELIDLTGAKKFHIGHDEVVGWKEKHYKKGLLNKNEKQLPPDLFLQDILVLHDYLRNKGVQTWMWSDMLYTKKEFPSMKRAGGNLNGLKGYSTIRKKIPTDIVMCAWHYRGNQREFPTATALANEGFHVLGATWKESMTIENYSSYIHAMPFNGDGMIATTWYGLNDKRRKEVYDIIRVSGKAFWNAK